MKHQRKRCECECSDSNDSSDSSESCEHKPRPKPNLYRLMLKQDDLKVLAKKVELADPIIRLELEFADPRTLLAPTDKAFKKSKLCPDLTLTELLAYHILPKSLPVKDMVNDTLETTLFFGKQVRVNVYQEPKFRDLITINGATVVEDDLKASNGYLHKISQVLCPPTKSILDMINQDPKLSKLSELVQKSSPALQQALYELSSGTLWAPDNKAFAELEKELKKECTSLEAIMRDQEVVDELLLYHLLPSTVFSAAVKKGLTRGLRTSLEHKKLSLYKKILRRKEDHCGCDDKPKRKLILKVIDDFSRESKVVKADLLATNGVVHIVDKVLLPNICYPQGRKH